MNVTSEELLNGLRKAIESAAEQEKRVSPEQLAMGVTSTQMGEIWEVSGATASKRLTKAVRAGFVEIHRSPRPNVLNELHPVPVYRPKVKDEQGPSVD